MGDDERELRERLRKIIDDREAEPQEVRQRLKELLELDEDGGEDNGRKHDNDRSDDGAGRNDGEKEQPAFDPG